MNLFRIFSNVQNLFRICSEFSEFSEFSVMFRISSEFLVIFRIFRLFSEYLAQKLVCKESLDFVVSGSHLGIPVNIKNTKFVKGLPMIDAQFRFNQCNTCSFREEHISQFSPIWSCVNTMTCGGSHLEFLIGINKELFRGPLNDYS